MVPEPDSHEVRRVLNRMAEVEHIEDNKLRAEVIRVLTAAPDYFWNAPATTNEEYHHPNARGLHGLWLHTKMVFTAYERMAHSWKEMGYITEEERDYGRAACLLHDLLKNGYPADHPEHNPENNDHEGSVSNHDLIMADYLRERTEMPDEVADAVAAHMGDWYDGPSPANQTPDNYLGLLLHTADMIASTSNITVGIYSPSDEITAMYSSVPRATFE